MSDHENHEHKFVYGGLRYHDSNYPQAGTSARTRYYEDWFYCESCLANQYTNKRDHGNNWDKPIEGSAPKGKP